jgi:proteic killer suppression protein
MAVPTRGRCSRLASASGFRISKVATRKLAQLDAAHTPDFLRSPPGNRPEGLHGREDHPRYFSTTSGGRTCASLSSRPVSESARRWRRRSQYWSSSTWMVASRRLSEASSDPLSNRRCFGDELLNMGQYGRVFRTFFHKCFL